MYNIKYKEYKMNSIDNKHCGVLHALSYLRDQGINNPLNVYIKFSKDLEGVLSVASKEWNYNALLAIDNKINELLGSGQVIA